MGRYERFSRLARECGQGTIEYIALFSIVAVSITVGLQLSGGGGVLGRVVAGSAPGGFQKGVCILFENPDCEVDDQGPDGENGTDDDYSGPAYNDPNRTPLERATWGDYVALGDSYSSGEGGSDYEEGTDNADYGCDLSWDIPPVSCENGEDKNTCHRSTEAYGPRISRGIDFEGDYTFGACSGAVTDDFTSPNDDQNGEDPQLEHVDDNTSLITLSIGGNDAHFTDVLEQCVIAGLNPVDDCAEDREQILSDIDAIKDEVVDLLRDARIAAPNARIVLVGYPKLFPDPPTSDGLGIDAGDQEFLNQAAERINDVLADAAEEVGGSSAGIEFVDARDAFEGCEIGTDNECINGLKRGTTNGKPPVDSGSFHPNDQGHQRLAELVERQIREGQ